LNLLSTGNYELKPFNRTLKQRISSSHLTSIMLLYDFPRSLLSSIF
jgi:hypothetical protein